MAFPSRHALTCQVLRIGKDMRKPPAKTRPRAQAELTCHRQGDTCPLGPRSTTRSLQAGHRAKRTNCARSPIHSSTGRRASQYPGSPGSKGCGWTVLLSHRGARLCCLCCQRNPHFCFLTTALMFSFSDSPTPHPQPKTRCFHSRNPMPENILFIFLSGLPEN